MAIPMVRHFDSEEAEKEYYDTHACLSVDYRVKADELGKNGPHWSIEEDRVDNYDLFEIKVTDSNRERLTELFNRFGPDITENLSSAGGVEQWWHHYRWSLIDFLARTKTEADRFIAELEELLPSLDK